jgi:hypothetical protein
MDSRTFRSGVTSNLVYFVGQLLRNRPPPGAVVDQRAAIWGGERAGPWRMNRSSGCGVDPTKRERFSMYEGVGSSLPAGSGCGRIATAILQSSS